MTFYEEIDIEEHMLYQNEIAQSYGIFTNTEKHLPYSRLVGVILKDYQTLQGMPFRKFFYYDGRFNRAYSRDQYHPAMMWFIDRMRTLRWPSSYEMQGTKYNFIIEPTPANGLNH